MPLAYAKDDAKRRISVEVSDPYDAADLRALVDRQIEDDAWTYGMLYDARQVSTALATDDLRAVMEHVGRLVKQLGPRGPVAIVTRSGALVGVTQIYAFFGAKIGLRVESFWDLADAQTWLDERMDRGR